MDQFGVLVESIGFKAHGRSSAPLADLKGTNKNNNRSNGFPGDVGFDADFSLFNNTSSSGYNSKNSSLNVDDLDGIFKSSGGSNVGKPPNPGFDDVFGGIGSGVNGIDLDSVFKGSSSNNYDDDDIFGLKKQSSGSIDGLFGSKVAQSKKADSVDDLLGDFGGIGVKSSGSRKNSGEKLDNASKSDDLLGNFGGLGMKSNGSKRNSVEKQENASKSDDLLGNFGGLGMKSNGSKRNSVEKQETALNSDDLLSGFGGKTTSSNGMKAETAPSRQSSGHSASSFSAEDPFGMFERADRSAKPNNGASGVEEYLDSFFTPDTQSSTRSNRSSATEDSVYDALFKNDVGPKAEKASSGSSYHTKKVSPVTNSTDDFSFMFGMGDAPSSGVFQEIKGESEERRRARLNHHIRTQERMAKVLNEKNQRDLEAQREQDEKHRYAETLDADIKRWAAGKEGNLRALLSSLQYVLWPECGWQPVSLTDLITSTSVKKVYYKATLCVHPDKVQQKGANIQQKYIAEKVFDLLKEAWNKFNSEEFKKQ